MSALAAQPEHWTCAVCGLSFDRVLGRRARDVCKDCMRGPLGMAAGELARRMVDVSQWHEREARLASITGRHQAVIALLEAVVKRPDLASDRLQVAMLRELTAPVVWSGPDGERRLFREALGLDPPAAPIPRPRPAPDTQRVATAAPVARRWP